MIERRLTFLQDGYGQGLAIALSQGANEGLTLVEICPPLRVEQPQPAASASMTTVSSPARAVSMAACNPV
jgi:hypothetical protein